METKKINDEKLTFRTSISLLVLLVAAYTLEAFNLMDYARICYAVMAVICVVAFVLGIKNVKI